MSSDTVLIVDDDATSRRSLRERFARDGRSVLEADTAARALERFTPAVDLVLLNDRLPDGDGLALLQQFKAQSPDTPVILMTAFSSVEHAVEAIKCGAHHYVRRPFNLDEVVATGQQALETARLRREVRLLRGSQSGAFGFDAIIGESPAMREAKALLERIAASFATTVLLTGETGTGKDLAARAIHHNSSRSGRPFLNLTCSTLPEPLLESELFGHERGAFTDAHQLKRGLLETADGGTVFLDEIGEMAPGLQAKLLRFLEDRTFRRIGGLADIRVDVRVVAATNRNLGASVDDGGFREDLFYRLQVVAVSLPPLRERPGDIPLLVDHCVTRYNLEFRKHVKGLRPAALTLLEQYRWPGNVRELRNAIERAMLLVDGEWLGPEEFAPFARSVSTSPFRLPAEGVNLDAVERQLVMQALERVGGNQTQAGHLLGINRDQVRYRIEKYGLPRPGQPGRESVEPTIRAS